MTNYISPLGLLLAALPNGQCCGWGRNILISQWSITDTHHCPGTTEANTSTSTTSPPWSCLQMEDDWDIDNQITGERMCWFLKYKINININDPNVLILEEWRNAFKENLAGFYKKPGLGWTRNIRILLISNINIKSFEYKMYNPVWVVKANTSTSGRPQYLVTTKTLLLYLLVLAVSLPAICIISLILALYQLCF